MRGVLVVTLAAAVIGLATLFRYEVHSERGVVISRYDRWTGAVEWWGGDRWEQ